MLTHFQHRRNCGCCENTRPDRNRLQITDAEHHGSVTGSFLIRWFVTDSFTHSFNESTKLPPGEQTTCLGMRATCVFDLPHFLWPLCSLQKLMSVNYLGSVYPSRAVITTMKERRVGRIVFLSSQAGQVGLYGFTAYSPSKFAIRGLAEALQMEVSAVFGFILLPVSSANVPPFVGSSFTRTLFC